MIYVNKIKLLESTENKTTKNENGENLFYLDITEVVLVHCNTVKNDYQQDSRVSIHLLLINHLMNL